MLGLMPWRPDGLVGCHDVGSGDGQGMRCRLETASSRDEVGVARMIVAHAVQGDQKESPPASLG